MDASPQPAAVGARKYAPCLEGPHAQTPASLMLAAILPGALASLAIGRFAPGLVTAYFTQDMIRSAAKQLAETYSNWSEMSKPEKIRAVVDTLGNTYLATTLGLHSLEGAKAPLRALAEKVKVTRCQAQAKRKSRVMI